MRVSALAERIDNLSLRERGFGLGAGIALLCFLWNALLMQPLEAKGMHVQAALQLRSAEILELNTVAQELENRNRVDPNAEMKLRLTSLRDQLAAVEANLGATTAHLVEPAQMAKVLEAVLRKTGGLELKAISGLGVSPLIPAGAGPHAATAAGPAKPAAAVAADEMPVVFKHGLRIEFAGDFFGTLEYLRNLEALNWKFFWDSIDFQVAGYPEAASAVTVYTLSLNDNWIGG